VSDAAVAEGRRSLAMHGRSFAWASWFLPPAARDDAAVLYGFCRRVDDLADDGGEGADAKLQALSDAIAGVAPSGSLAAATRAVLGPVVGAALELIDGVRGDLGVVRVADDAALVRYGYRVAGTVGLMMCRVLGAERAGAPFAIDLGVAMQITNICRDVASDRALGRVYLPATRLVAAGTSPEAVLAGTADPRAVARVVLDLLDVADRYYASADQGIRFLPPRSRIAVLVAARIYRGIGVALRARSGDALAGRVVVSSFGKVGWTVAALGAWLRLAFAFPMPHDRALHRPLGDRPGAHA